MEPAGYPSSGMTIWRTVSTAEIIAQQLLGTGETLYIIFSNKTFKVSIAGALLRWTFERSSLMMKDRSGCN